MKVNKWFYVNAAVLTGWVLRGPCEAKYTRITPFAGDFGNYKTWVTDLDFVQLKLDNVSSGNIPVKSVLHFNILPVINETRISGICSYHQVSCDFSFIYFKMYSKCSEMVKSS